MPVKKIYLSLMILFMIACSKTSPPAVIPPVTKPIVPVIPVVPVMPVVNCKIVAVALISQTGDTVSHSTYQYNIDGTLAQSTMSGTYGYTASYSYNGKLIYRNVAAGINSSVDTITLNDAGMISLRKEQIGSQAYITSYTYDVNGLLTTLNQNSPAPYSNVYTFTNGDNTLVQDASGSSSADTLIYDLSKPAVLGNMDMVNQLLSSGAMYIKNKHLLVEERRGTIVIYDYTYNAEGNIASMKTTVNGTSFGITKYKYECK